MGEEKNVILLQVSPPSPARPSVRSGLKIKMYRKKKTLELLISKFRLFFSEFWILFLGDSPASECYLPTFWDTLFHLHMRCELITPPVKMELTE